MPKHRELHYHWKWRLPASPEALWPFVADTNRFNRDVGLPALERGGSTPAGAQRLRLVRLGVRIEWEEEPFEWVRPHRFGVRRRYLRGPVAEMDVLAELTATEHGTELSYRVRARPRNLLGMLAIPLQIGWLSARKFAEVFRRYGELAAAGARPAALRAVVHFAEGGRERLRAYAQKLLSVAPSPELVPRLIEVIEHEEDIVVARLRAYALADDWRVPRRSVLELCLHATRVGLLDLQWDQVCPHCRGPQHTGASLDQMEASVHCESCGIDFMAAFDQSIELTFRPNPAVRPVEIAPFCVGGPQVTPHIVVQQLLQAREQRTLTPAFEQGRYRLRARALPGAQPLSVANAGATNVTLRAANDAWLGEEVLMAPRPQLCLENATQQEQMLILERTAWSDQAAMAAEVIALQCFRDLFTREVLRPGDHFSVGSLAVVFTDLQGSTRLYREIGDAPAFGRVRDHFEVLRAAITEENGALIKTIGDAVMAVFRSPAAALAAILRAQERLTAPADGSRPLVLKAGIHYGPCIAVTLNDRLDYFGSTVNVAARLEKESRGGDVVISRAVHADPEVAALLAADALPAERFEAQLRGIGQEAVELWRVRRAAPAG